MATLQVLVLDIIMNQREVMDQLQGGGGGQRPQRVTGQRLTSEHAEGGTEGFAL
jgi:hypothetical protein